MKKLLSITFVVLVAAFGIVACSSSGETAPPVKGVEPESVDLTDTQNLTPEQKKLAESKGGGETKSGDQAETEGGR
jgi:hypothetical protein